MNENIKYNVVVIDAPGEYPLTLEQVRLQCKVDADGSPPAHPDDDILNRLIADATGELDSVNGWLGRALITQTLELVMDRFPSKIQLPYPPLQSVTSIKYIDSDGVEQTLDAANYRVVDDMEPAYVEPAYGVAWPAIRGTAAVRVRFVAGYGAADDVPDKIKQYMLHIIAYRYEYREAVSAGTVNQNPFIEYMLNNYRIF